MPLDRVQHHPLMCLTQDGLPLSHVEQAQQLCDAGAKWIQLRMKNAEPLRWAETAAAVVKICRRHGAVCIINDSVDVAMTVDADGVHLGSNDEDWAEARRRLGSKKLLGGTINNPSDALHAIQCNSLDYVGVGPWRFTANKKNLAPVLGPSGIRALLDQLDGLPAWVIGGIEAPDLVAVRATGAMGAAVSTALFRSNRVAENFRALQVAWGAAEKELRS